MRTITIMHLLSNNDPEFGKAFVYLGVFFILVIIPALIVVSLTNLYYRLHHIRMRNKILREKRLAAQAKYDRHLRSK